MNKNQYAAYEEILDAYADVIRFKVSNTKRGLKYVIQWRYTNGLLQPDVTKSMWNYFEAEPEVYTALKDRYGGKDS